ncbi:alpha/beta fold hydrolase [Actinosynnema sp. ALI-1.44]|uniref:alpha/beta fold hydrolase n=1 Tax=Actinosynnema sp. ALI-1.44 TaxID=1933779 RepID=UPI00143D41B0|nr:alpha/beta fold hydrolase [Actinosynnema sp. ALI-1.44]
MIRELTLHGGIPALAYGQGPPLVYVRGLVPQAGNPDGRSRWVETRQMDRLARGRTIYSVGRRPGLKAGTTMAELAADLAEAIRRKFREPVEVMGISTSGSIALQAAADHHDAVRKVVACATAARLGPLGKQVQRECRDLLAKGEYRDAMAALVPGLTENQWAKGAMTRVMRLSGAPEDPDGMIAMLDAEDGYDLACENIAAPTLLIAGEHDLVYPRELAEQTAQRIPGAQLKLYAGRGHMGVLRDKDFHPDIIRFLVN